MAKDPKSSQRLEIFKCECSKCDSYFLGIRNAQIIDIEGELIPGLALTLEGIKEIHRTLGERLLLEKASRAIQSGMRGLDIDRDTDEDAT